ncbi:MAG: glycoside hydrolase family 88 protein, partial [Prevotellaceae bacterium]|nr:glycoside hydrolase family 88 protein [Prevotellaceae bacterium]
WLDYPATGNQRIKDLAESYTQALDPITRMPVFDHDLGFVIYTSYGKAYAATGQDIYKKGIINAAERLCDLYNPKVGTMLSWPRNVEMFGGHHTIMDNMINLELLFAASRLSGNNKYHDIAFRHAETTMKNHFRDDYTSYHVVIYDSITGKKVRGVTHQGYSDQSMWARGQAWAIYGFTMTYRETRDSRFLDFAQKVADLYIQRLPKDRIPYWDFDDPKIPNSYKDVSAACIVASALIELSGFVGNEKGNAYLKAAKKMLKNIKKRYSSKKANSAMLMHAVGNLPAGSEIDASIIYADYYYMEALSRLSDKVGKGRCDSLYANSR